LEWLVSPSDIFGQRLEWWWVLHRSFRSQVRFYIMTNLSGVLIHSHRFERELEALRKELAETSTRFSVPSTPTDHPSTLFETDNSSAGSASPDYLAITLPGTELDSIPHGFPSVLSLDPDPDLAKKNS